MAAAPHPNWTGKVLRTDRRPQVVIGPLIAVGGEGAVHRIEGSAGFLAKLYHEPPTADRTAKLEILTNLTNDRVRRVTAMPVAILKDENRAVGFIMPLADSRAEVHHWFSPKDRRNRYPQATFDLIVAITRNLAACIDEIHAADLVIGDVNERGFLIGIGKENLGTVTAIDCDSFQVIGGNGRLFKCEVGIPEYLPPELAGHPLGTVQRLPEHDRFGLAILAYKLLMMGRHPYMGIYPNELDDGVATAIANGWYVHHPRAAAQGVRPPPANLDLATVGPAIAELWMRAFAGRSVDRPTAASWISALEALGSDLVGCRSNTRHRHRRSLGSCPWCAFARAHRLDFFPPPGSSLDVVFDLSVDSAAGLVVSIRGWLQHLQPVVIPRPSPSDPRLPRFESEKAGMQSLLGPLRAAVEETKAYVAEIARRSREMDVWREACERVDAMNRSRRLTWSERNRQRRQAWVDAVRVANRLATEGRRHHAVKMTEHREWLRGNRNLIIITSFAMVVLVGVRVCMARLDILVANPPFSIGWVVAGFIGILIGQVLVRRRAMARPPIEPKPAEQPPEPATLPEPVSEAHPHEPRFPDLPAPFHRHLGAIKKSGMEQATRLIGTQRTQVPTTANHANAQAIEWEHRTSLELNPQIDNLRSMTNRLVEDLDNYRRLRVSHTERMQAAKATWDEEAMAVYLDSIEVSDARLGTGMGHNLIAALESFGIETALDVLQELVPGRVRVPGIGPRRTNTLEEWVRGTVIPRFDRSKFPLSSSPRVQQIQRETLATKGGLESAIGSAMERIPAIKAAHVRLRTEREAQARAMAEPLRNALFDAEAMASLMAWWEQSLHELVD